MKQAMLRCVVVGGGFLLSRAEPTCRWPLTALPVLRGLALARIHACPSSASWPATTGSRRSS